MSGTSADTIAAAIEAAKLAAQSAVAAQAAQAGAVTTVAPAPSQAVAAPAPVTRGVPMTMEDMVGGGISVEGWLKVSEFGFKLGPTNTLYTDTILVEIDLAAVAPCLAIKFGNPAVYFKTYDRVTEAKGGSWAEAVRKAQASNPNNTEYRAVDVPMRIVEDVISKPAKGAPVILLPAGMVAGYSTSTTNWGAWETFYNSCKRAGLAGQTVRAHLGWEKRTNKAGNEWGIMTWTLVEPTA